MSSFVSYIVGGLLAVGAMDYFHPVLAGNGGLVGLSASTHNELVVDRSSKGDRPALEKPTRNVSAPATEVVPMRDVTVIYTNRKGRVLFRGDPPAPSMNVTVVSRRITAEATPRDHEENAVQSAPAQPQLKPVRLRLPLGCEPAVSSLVVPVTQASRCIT